MRKLFALAAAASLLSLAGVAGAGDVPPFPSLPGTWSHAEINVTLKRAPHTLILDRGRITRVSGTQLTLRERDGQLVPVPLAASAVVVVDRVPATIYALRRGMKAQTLRIDGGPAVRIRATT